MSALIGQLVRELATGPPVPMGEASACVGCGCTDLAACAPFGCYWLRLDRTRGKGVCSSCRPLVGAWDASVRWSR